MPGCGSGHPKRCGIPSATHTTPSRMTSSTSRPVPDHVEPRLAAAESAWGMNGNLRQPTNHAHRAVRRDLRRRAQNRCLRSATSSLWEPPRPTPPRSPAMWIWAAPGARSRDVCCRTTGCPVSRPVCSWFRCVRLCRGLDLDLSGASLRPHRATGVGWSAALGDETPQVYSQPPRRVLEGWLHGCLLRVWIADARTGLRRCPGPPDTCRD